MDENAAYAEALRALQARDRATARERLMALLRGNPRSEAAWLLLASAVDEPAKAIDCLSRAVALNPGNVEAQAWLARLQAEAAGAQPGAPAAGAALTEPDDENRPVPRLGQFLLEYKFVTAEQLAAALQAQRLARAAGQVFRLGDILLEQGALGVDRLHFALRQQQRSADSLLDD